MISKEITVEFNTCICRYWSDEGLLPQSKYGWLPFLPHGARKTYRYRIELMMNGIMVQTQTEDNGKEHDKGLWEWYLS